MVSPARGGLPRVDVRHPPARAGPRPGRGGGNVPDIRLQGGGGDHAADHGGVGGTDRGIAGESMMGMKLRGVVSHHEREVAELAADRELAVEYVKVAMEALESAEDRAGGLIALRCIAEAYGDVAVIDPDAARALRMYEAR